MMTSEDRNMKIEVHPAMNEDFREPLKRNIAAITASGVSLIAATIPRVIPASAGRNRACAIPYTTPARIKGVVCPIQRERTKGGETMSAKDPTIAKGVLIVFRVHRR